MPLLATSQMFYNFDFCGILVADRTHDLSGNKSLRQHILVQFLGLSLPQLSSLAPFLLDRVLAVSVTVVLVVEIDKWLRRRSGAAEISSHTTERSRF